MRYVFIVQGEGRGHLTQAISMERLLRENGHEVAAVLVGKSPARRLPAFFARTIQAPVEMFESFNFVPSASNRKASSLKTGLYNVLHSRDSRLSLQTPEVTDDMSRAPIPFPAQRLQIPFFRIFRPLCAELFHEYGGVGRG